MPHAADIGTGDGRSRIAWISSRLPMALGAAFLLEWLALAIAPRYRQDWALENVLVAAAVALLLWLQRHVR